LSLRWTVSHGEASELRFQVRLAKRLAFGDPKLGSTVRRSLENLRRMLLNLIDSVEGSGGGRGGNA